jgi:cytochrome c-type biogenesis protein CcmF
MASVVAAVRPREVRVLAGVAAGALGGAAATLGWLLWHLDLSYVYVADHARREIGNGYRLAGLWGGADGSLVMFTAFVAVIVAVAPGVAPIARRCGAGTVALLAATSIWFADPFERLQIPAISGGGLQPILEHPAMLYHPPILYAGLVTTLVPWLLTIGARALDDTFRATARRALLVAFVLVTVGQLTGANWAYVELGWGGYWGWDPVENGVLVTWLLLLAAVHAVGHATSPRLLGGLLAAPWLSVLIGVAVTRAGVGGSVHAFSNDRRTTSMLLVVIAFTVTVTAATLLRLPRAASERRLALVGTAFFAIAATLVLEGVLYPIPAPGEPLVSGHFYATVLGPVAVLAVAASTLALGRSRPGWFVVGALGALTAASLLGARSPFALAVAAAVGCVATGLVAGLVGQPGTGTAATRWSTRLGHVGFAVMLVGIAGSTQADRVTISLNPGAEVEVGGVTLRHRSVAVEPGPSPGSSAVVATLEVIGSSTTLRPSLVSFEARGVLLAETALDSRPVRDVQVVLRTADDRGAARYDIAVTPLVQLVWWGALLIAAAGVWAFADQSRPRLRPSRARSSSADTVAESARSDA